MSAPETPDARAHLAGWGAVALVDVVVLTLTLPARTPIGARAATHFYDAAHLLAMGLVATGIAAAWRRFGPARWWIGWAALAAASWALAHPLLVEDLSGPAGRLPEIVPMGARVAVLTLSASLAIPVAVRVGGLLAKGRWRLLGVAMGLVTAVVNGVVEEQGFTSTHLVAAIAAAIAIGRSLEGAEILAAIA